eukprot:379007-Prymnesium_polylepis.1
MCDPLARHRSASRSRPRAPQQRAAGSAVRAASPSPPVRSPGGLCDQGEPTSRRQPPGCQAGRGGEVVRPASAGA